MKIIVSAAHFSVCQCGMHGRVITANGGVSPEVCSKETARKVLWQFAKDGKVADYEMGEASRQIDASALEENEEDVSRRNRLVVDMGNFIQDQLCHSDNAIAPNPSKWAN
jgi:hypothetical protein